MAYRMIVRTETAGPRGGTRIERETIRHIPEAELESYRDAARTSAPAGATRTIRVVPER